MKNLAPRESVLVASGCMVGPGVGQTRSRTFT